jgi:zinc finger protein 830
MADVRSMLKAERAARRITHPHASYTSDGKLLCNLCESIVKSEAQWQSHLHSTQHTLRSQRAQEAKAIRAAGGTTGSKKRKAESLDVDSPVATEKKRARPSDQETVNDVDKQTEASENRVEESVQFPNTSIPAAVDQNGPPALDPEAPADEAELAAFERELAALEAESRAAPGTSALDSTATISAAPMTAEQVAAQAREEAFEQRGKRDQELEEEREDAARAMEEELEEMEGLEERVKKLREKREALRKGGGLANDVKNAEVDPEDPPNGVGEGGDSSDEDDEDEWKFGGS